MRKKLIGMFVCMLMLAICLPVTGTMDDDEKPSAGTKLGTTGVTRFWPKEHILAIEMDKVYVYESGDREAYEPGEYFFKIYAFPSLFHWTTDIYEVGDENPDIPYNFHHIASIRTKFTPQIILVLALEEDKKEDLNFNEFMDWKVFKVNIPYGDYPPDGMYTSDPVIWENDYFKAVVKFTFHYE
jgi:hypothetical protein